MIRRKVSTGLLRAASKSTAATSSASNATAASAAVGASPMQQQSANLASAVLLSSQRSWKGETVATLKGELKKRGLSQTGNKSILIARLTSAETSQHLPPSPSVPASYRKISTTSATGAAAGGSGKKAIPSNSDDTATKNDTKEMTTGPEISSKTAEAESFEEPTKEQLNVAPGLPASGKAAPSSGERLSVKMPQSQEENQTEQVIPLEPDNFRSKVDSKPADQQEGKDDVPDPKILTVASASTHISGGPVSAIHESAEQLSEAASNLDLAPAFKGAGESLASAVNSLTGMSKTAGEFSRSFIPEIGLPKSPKGGKGSEYKAPKEGLDDGEKKGLWVLGGIVGLGLLLGGPKKDNKGKGAGHLKDDIKNMAGMGKKGVQGDAEWEKASGAGVVGHGKRKE